MVKQFEAVREFRRARSDSYSNNWLLKIPHELQLPFAPSHGSMRALKLHRGQPVHELAADLRRAFSGIVTGNVKEHGIAAIEREGPFEICGDASILRPLDQLLRAFVLEQRMKLPGSEYHPCYRLVG